jgi:hypothetical protein
MEKDFKPDLVQLGPYRFLYVTCRRVKCSAVLLRDDKLRVTDVSIYRHVFKTKEVRPFIMSVTIYKRTSHNIPED